VTLDLGKDTEDPDTTLVNKKGKRRKRLYIESIIWRPAKVGDRMDVKYNLMLYALLRGSEIVGIHVVRSCFA
jgi:hypothetical protein